MANALQKYASFEHYRKKLTVAGLVRILSSLESLKYLYSFSLSIMCVLERNNSCCMTVSFLLLTLFLVLSFIVPTSMFTCMLNLVIGFHKLVIAYAKTYMLHTS